MSDSMYAHTVYASICICAAFLFILTANPAKSVTNHYSYSIGKTSGLDIWVTKSQIKMKATGQDQNGNWLLYTKGDPSTLHFVNPNSKTRRTISESGINNYQNFSDDRFEWMKKVKDRSNANVPLIPKDRVEPSNPVKFDKNAEIKWEGHPAERGKLNAGSQTRGTAVLFNPPILPVHPEQRQIVNEFRHILNQTSGAWVSLLNNVPTVTRQQTSQLPPFLLRLAKFSTPSGSLVLTEWNQTKSSNFSIPDNYETVNLDAEIKQMPRHQIKTARKGFLDRLLTFVKDLFKSFVNNVKHSRVGRALFDFEAPGDEPVLLVHGFMDTTETLWWKILERHLRGEGYTDSQIHTLSLEPFILLGIDSPKEYSRQVAEKVKSIHKKTGKKVDIIAHSMGGLDSRWFIEENNGAQYVDDLVTLGTPHQGTNVAYLGFFTEGGRDMFPNSDLIEQLNDGSLAQNVEYTAVWGALDEVYVQKWRAKIPQRQLASVQSAKNIPGGPVTHLAQIWLRVVFDRYRNRLD